MTEVKLSGRLPKGTTNGVADLGDKLSANPETEVVAIVLLQPKSLTMDYEEDMETATLHVIAIEPLDGAESTRIRKALTKSYAKRTGVETLPFDEDDDPTTKADAADAAKPVEGVADDDEKGQGK